MGTFIVAQEASVKKAQRIPNLAKHEAIPDVRNAQSALRHAILRCVGSGTYNISPWERPSPDATYVKEEKKRFQYCSAAMEKFR
jgi:hypothetical protein